MEDEREAALGTEGEQGLRDHRVTGDDCFVMKTHVRDVVHLEEVIDRFVVLGDTTTSIMQSSPVPARGLAVDA